VDYSVRAALRVMSDCLRFALALRNGAAAHSPHRLRMFFACEYILQLGVCSKSRGFSKKSEKIFKHPQNNAAAPYLPVTDKYGAV
jgi:hypothetical protein